MSLSFDFAALCLRALLQISLIFNSYLVFKSLGVKDDKRQPKKKIYFWIKELMLLSLF